MTRDDIFKIANEAGFMQHLGVICIPNVLNLERFAALVAAAEREACAQVAENMLRFYTQAVTGVPQAIRARGQE